MASRLCKDPHAAASLYGIHDPKDGQCIYVGFTVNRRARWGDHKARLRSGSHTNAQLQNLWNKRGKLVFKVLQTGMARLMLHAEVEAIAKLRREIGSRLCNATAGGEGASGMTRTVKRAIAAKSRAAWESPEYRMRFARSRGRTPEQMWGKEWRTLDIAKQRAITNQTAMLARVGRLLTDIRKACEPSPKKLHKQDFVWPTLDNETFVPLTKGLWAAIPTANAGWAKAQCKWCAQTHNGKPRPKANVVGGGAVIMPQPWRVFGHALTKAKQACHFGT